MSRKISDTNVETIKTLKEKIEKVLRACSSLEEAAQTFTNLLFEEFEEAIVLIRFFATIPFKKLPISLQFAVNKLADVEGMTTLINDDTPVLTLLGSRGGEEIRNFRQYFGIPLASTDFIDSIPMVSQLLKELGFDLNWEKDRGKTIQERDIETNSTGFLSGVFYIPDAQHAVNTKGEKILSVLDRVATYNLETISEVETIFGVGGAYISGPFIAIILFSQESLEKEVVERFMPLANYFKTSTLKLVLNGRIFA